MTAAIITGILSAKLTPGKWTDTLSFWNAFFNPTYLPSLAFRTGIAIVLAIALISVFVKLLVKNKQLQKDIFGVFGKINAVAFPFLLITGVWYLYKIPDEAYELIVWSTGMTKENFTVINIAGLIVFVLFGLWMLVRPKKVSILLTIAVFFASIGFIAEFEMVRESVRKPFIIYDYMYANGILEKDAEVYNKEGYLKTSPFTKVKEVTEENKFEAGEELYKGQCLACHTIDGWRETRAFSHRINGWSEEALDQYISTLHEARPFMPPFVGTDEEREALAHYLHEVTKDKATAKRVKEEAAP